MVAVNTAGDGGEVGVSDSSLSSDFSVSVRVYDASNSIDEALASLRIWDLSSDCMLAKVGFFSDHYGATCSGGSFTSACSGNDTAMVARTYSTWHLLEADVTYHSSGATVDVCIDGTCLSDSGGSLQVSCTTADAVHFDDSVSGGVSWDDFMLYSAR